MKAEHSGATTLALLLLAGVALTVSVAAQDSSGQSAKGSVPTVEPMSMRLGAGASVTSIATSEEQDSGDPEKLSPEPAGATAGWTTILTESAEGAFPADNGWTVMDNNGDSGDDFWDDLSCRSFTGSWSIWCADIGDQADCANYDDDMTSWMIFGPFSLADADDARAEFYLWSETQSPEIPIDYVFWGASANGVNFSGYRPTNNLDWTLVEFDFKSVPTLGDLTGEPAVWFAVIFISDSSVNTFEGSYVDDILIEKHIALQLLFEDGFETGTTTPWTRTVSP
jgi:hypothetical protein